MRSKILIILLFGFIFMLNTSVSVEEDYGMVLGQAFIKTINAQYSQSNELIEKAFKLLENGQNSYYSIDYLPYYINSINYYNLENYNESYNMANLALDNIVEGKDDYEIKFLILLNLEKNNELTEYYYSLKEYLLEIPPQKANFFYIRAIYHLSNCEYEKSFEDIEIIKLAGNCIESSLLLSNYYLQTNMIDKALSEVKLAELADDYLSIVSKVNVYYMMSMVYYRKNDFMMAKDYFNKAKSFINESEIEYDYDIDNIFNFFCFNQKKILDKIGE